MNYRKRKKELTKQRDKANRDLERNPLNSSAIWFYNFAVKHLEYLKNVKRSKEKAKTA